MYIKTINIIIILVMFIAGCGSSLRIRDFQTEKSANKNSYLTSQLSYSRNMVGNAEINPPLTEDWEENVQALPNNGFTSVDNWLFFGMLNGYLAAIDVDDGDLEGKKNLGDACAVPPTVYDNVLYQTFETGSKGLIAYDITSGHSLWALDGNFSRSSPIIVNDLVLFQSLKGEIIAFNYLNGEEIWRKSLYKNIRNSAAYSNNMMITVTLDGSVYAFEPRSGDIQWEIDLETPVFADPVIEDNKLYVTTHAGKLQVIELLEGRLLSHTNLNIELFNSPTIDENTIYITSGDGVLYALNKTTLERKWTFAAEGPIYGSALITSSYVYISTLAQKLYIIDKSEGKQLQKIELLGRARSAPIISQGKLILACEENRVIAYVESR